ncbi:MAG: DUF1572 family protein [Pirellulaceae bacterium]
MNTEANDRWLAAALETATSYRRMIDGIIEQLTPDELVARPAKGVNSVAVILRHLGGNLESRWTDFLTSDGEKPDRNRDVEFGDWQADIPSLISYFERGWNALICSLRALDSDSLNQTVLIRGEPHSVPQAINRTLTHISYHVGQMAIIARQVHAGEWKWLTIALWRKRKSQRTDLGNKIKPQRLCQTIKRRVPFAISRDPMPCAINMLNRLQLPFSTATLCRAAENGCYFATVNNAIPGRFDHFGNHSS